MGRKFRALELLQQPRLRKAQRVEPFLTLSLLFRFSLSLRCTELGVFDLIGD